MYGLALLPSRKTTEGLIKFRNHFADEINGPLWDFKLNRPHVALFKTEFKPETNLNKIVGNIYNEALFDTPSSIFQGISVENRRWVFGNVSKNSFINQMHNLSVDTCKPFIAKDKIKLKKFMGETVEDVDNYLKYGYRYIGERFTPQFIFGRYTSELSTLSEKIIEEYEKNFLGEEVLFTKLVIYKTGKSNFMGPIVASQKLLTFKERLFIS